MRNQSILVHTLLSVPYSICIQQRSTEIRAHNSTKGRRTPT